MFTFCKFPAVLEGFRDANRVADNDEVRMFYIEGRSYSWNFAKQTCIARSIMEFEFIALELAGQEAKWRKSLLINIPLWGKQSTLISLHCDSQAAIRVMHNSVYNGNGDISILDMVR